MNLLFQTEAQKQKFMKYWGKQGNNVFLYLIKNGLLFGFISIIFSIVNHLMLNKRHFFNEEFYVGIIIDAMVTTVIGIIFGFMMWHFSRRKYLETLAENENQEVLK